jgi:hypothetical protein
MTAKRMDAVLISAASGHLCIQVRQPRNQSGDLGYKVCARGVRGRVGVMISVSYNAVVFTCESGQVDSSTILLDISVDTLVDTSKM